MIRLYVLHNGKGDVDWFRECSALPLVGVVKQFGGADFAQNHTDLAVISPEKVEGSPDNLMRIGPLNQIQSSDDYPDVLDIEETHQLLKAMGKGIEMVMLSTEHNILGKAQEMASMVINGHIEGIEIITALDTVDQVVQYMCMIPMPSICIPLELAFKVFT